MQELIDFITENGFKAEWQVGFQSDNMFENVYTLQPNKLPHNLVYVAKSIFDPYLNNGQTIKFGNLKCTFCKGGYYGAEYSFTESFRK